MHFAHFVRERRAFSATLAAEVFGSLSRPKTARLRLAASSLLRNSLGFGDQMARLSASPSVILEPARAILRTAGAGARRHLRAAARASIGVREELPRFRLSAKPWLAGLRAGEGWIVLISLAWARA